MCIHYDITNYACIHYIHVKVRFMDGEKIWTKFSKDLSRNVKYIEYIQSIPMLHILLQPCYEDSLTTYIHNINTTSLTTLTPVCTVYLDIRYLA